MQCTLKWIFSFTAKSTENEDSSDDSSLESDFVPSVDSDSDDSSSELESIEKRPKSKYISLSLT